MQPEVVGKVQRPFSALRWVMLEPEWLSHKIITADCWIWSWPETIDRQESLLQKRIDSETDGMRRHVKIVQARYFTTALVKSWEVSTGHIVGSPGFSRLAIAAASFLDQEEDSTRSGHLIVYGQLSNNDIDHGWQKLHPVMQEAVYVNMMRTIIKTIKRFQQVYTLSEKEAKDSAILHHPEIKRFLEVVKLGL